MRKRWLTITVLAIVTVLLASAVAATRGSSASAAHKAAFSACLVTDVGGLNDKSFNHLAYVGLLKAQSTGVKGRVIQSQSSEPVHPEPPDVRPERRRDHDRRRVPDDGCDGRGRNVVPEEQVRHRRRRRHDAEAQAEERSGAALPRAAGRVPRRVRGGTLDEAAGRRRRRLGRRHQDPAGRPLHRRLPVRREEGRSGDQDPERLLEQLHRSGEVQGSGAQPDRRRLRRRVPGRGLMRPRRPRRGAQQEHLRRRRGRGPGLPRTVDHDERAQEGGRGRLQRDQGRSGGLAEDRHEQAVRRRRQRRRLRQVEREGPGQHPQRRWQRSTHC